MHKKKHAVLKSNENKNFESFDSCFTNYVQKLNKLKIKHVDKNSVIDICQSLIEGTLDLAFKLKDENYADHLNSTKSYVMKQIWRVATRRLRENILKKQKTYVAPEEIAIGLKWETQRVPTSDLPTHQLQQNKFYYVHCSY